MQVIDAHAHLGSCRIFDLEVRAEELLGVMDKHEIDAAVVMPFPGAAQPIRVHNEIADLAQKHPGRIYGMVNLNPHCDRDEYESEVRRCVEGLGFVGVKLHTVGHAINPLSADASKVFELGRELEIPVMVHSGPGIPFALPSHCLPRAQEFPEVPIIIAHAGFTILTGEAFAVAKASPNIYLESSWLFADDLKWLISALGAERVMMGTDLPRNVGPALAICDSTGLTEEEKRLYLGGTALNLYKIQR